MKKTSKIVIATALVSLTLVGTGLFLGDKIQVRIDPPVGFVK